MKVLYFDITDRKLIEDRVNSYISLLDTIMEQKPICDVDFGCHRDVD